MSLTSGRGPLSPNPAGVFNVDLPPDLIYVEPLRRRVRGWKDGRVVIDTERGVLVHRPGKPPNYAFLEDEVRTGLAEPEPGIPGYAMVAFDALDCWYEEDEQVLGHPRNPYHRVDCLKTSRRLRVEVRGVVIVDTSDTVVLHETALEPRLYVSPAEVRMDLLMESPTTTYCPYKGTASYWSAVVDGTVVENAAWSYLDPLPESRAIGGLLSFDETLVTVVHGLPT